MARPTPLSHLGAPRPRHTGEVSDATPERPGPQGQHRLELTFRVATPRDANALVALIESAYRGEDSRLGWTTEADLLAGQRTDAPAVEAVIAEPRSWMLVAETTELVGCCHLRLEDRGGYFGMFCVRPGRQGHGLGRAIVAEAERRIAELGGVALRMLVIRQRVDLIAWYERLGYALTGATSPFPYGDERFRRPLVDDLEFVELAKPLGRPR
jgi:ribosomal protein S18 acetylase RimI-like enzyme